MLGKSVVSYVRYNFVVYDVCLVKEVAGVTCPRMFMITDERAEAPRMIFIFSTDCKLENDR